MEAVIIDERQRSEWEEFIRENDHAIAWQSYDWSEVLRRHYKFDFYPIAARENGKVLGVLPLYRLRTPFSEDSLISVPYAVAGGAVSDHEEARKLMLAKAFEISRRHGSCRIVLKQYKIRMEGDLLTDDNYYNRELSLSEELDKIRAKFSETNRRMIESTDGIPYTLECSSSKVGAYYQLLLQHLHARGIPCVSRKWIEDLLGFKMYSIALLKCGGTIVAGTLVKEFKKTVSFPFTCIQQRPSETVESAYRLYWELIRHFSNRGFEICHSGRIPSNDMTEEYRLGWGGERHGYYYQYYPCEGIRTESNTKRGRKREILERGWKLLPRKVAGVLGPSIIRQFP